MKKHLKYIWALFAALLFLTFSCQKNPNEWAVEDGEPRLFQPVIFESSLTRATSVEMKFTTILNAAEYILEFSRDSFATIDKSYTLLADTMVPFAQSNNKMRDEYRYTFDGLYGTTEYDARLKGRSAKGVESKFKITEFLTTEENLFSHNYVSLTGIKAFWNADSNVTNAVLYSVDNEGETDYPADDVMTELANKPVSGTDTEIAFDELSPGTTYQLIMWFGDILRGRIKFTTLGVPGAVIYAVPDDATSASLATTLADYVAAGTTDVTLSFAAGKTYAMGGRLTFPTGIYNVYFAGTQADDGSLPLLEGISFEIESSMGTAFFRNLHMTGGSTGTMFFQVSGAKTFDNVVFENCRIRLVNSVLRMSGGATGKSASINNCWISNTGGWGMINLGGDTGGIGSIRVSNSTLTDINTRFADVRIKTELIFRNITCVNINDSMGHLWLFDNGKLSTVTITDMIIGGPNKGTKLHSTNGNYSTMPTYETNYITSDLVQDTRPLTGITQVPLDVYGLFVDPDNGDFHIKPGAGFVGTGVAGDPRWFDR